MLLVIALPMKERLIKLQRVWAKLLPLSTMPLTISILSKKSNPNILQAYKKQLPSSSSAAFIIHLRFY